MAKKRSFGLSLSQQALEYVDRYANAKQISRSEAIEHLVWNGLENIQEISRVNKEIKFSLEQISLRMKNEADRLAKLQIQNLKISAVAKGFVAFHLSNTLKIDEQTAKMIEQKSIQKVIESLKYEKE